MQQKRLFIGVFIDNKNLGNRINKLKKEFDKVTFGKWIEPNNLHFTMKFLGDVDIDKIPQIKSGLGEILIEYPNELMIRGLAVMPMRGLPRVLYAAIEAKDRVLDKSAMLIDSYLSAIGFELESKEFLPHITLLRLKSSTNDFKSVLRNYASFELGKQPSFKIELIESRLTPSGPIYKIL